MSEGIDQGILLKPCHLKLTLKEGYLQIQATSEAQNTNIFPKKNLRTLTEVHLELDQFTFAEEDLDVLNSIISRIELMKKLKVRVVRTNNILYYKLISLPRRISQTLQAIEEVDINFTGSEIFDEHIIELTDNLLSQLKNLQVFALNLYDTKITEKAIESIGDKFLSHMTKMKTMKIDLGSLKNVSSFVKLFENLPGSLTDLELKLNDTKIDSTALERLGMKINTLMNVRSLSLGLRNIKLNDLILWDLFASFPNHISSVRVNIKCNDDVSAECRKEIRAARKIKNLVLELDSLMKEEDKIFRIGRGKIFG